MTHARNPSLDGGHAAPLQFRLAGFPQLTPHPEVDPAKPAQPAATYNGYPLREPAPAAPARPAAPRGPFDDLIRPRLRIPKPAAIAAAILAVIVLLWLIWPSRSAAPHEEAERTPAAEDLAALERLLPQGYPDGTCYPTSLQDGARAVIRCGRNTRPNGPRSATYTLAEDTDTLHSQFNTLTSEATVVVCPGNIQSPGPWRRNAALTRTAGTLVCTTNNNTATLAWTDDDALLLAVTELDDPTDQAMSKLYNWWSKN